MQDEQLDQAAAFLARDPSASLARVASAIGVGRATLARHFPKREDLLRALSLRSLHALEEALFGLEDEVASAVDYLRQSFERIVPLGANFHFLQAEIAVLKDPRFRSELDRQHEEMILLVDELKEEGAIDADIPEAWAVASMDAVLYAAWQSVEDGHLEAEQAAELAFHTYLRGLQSMERSS